MPELPEVEVCRRYVEKHAMRQRIVAVRVPDGRILRNVSAAALSKRTRGRSFVRTRRHGKHLFVELDRDGWVHLQFGMTGDLSYYSGDKQPRFSKVIFDFVRDRHLAFEDARLFGGVSLVEDPEKVIAARRLGVDPLDRRFTTAAFRSTLRGRKGAIKPVLMSQTVVAGLGNLYVDETLYQISMHPGRLIDDISDAEVGELVRAIRRVLKVTITRHESGRELPRSFLTLHRSELERCPKCGGAIARTVFSGRTTYYCRSHQQ